MTQNTHKAKYLIGASGEADLINISTDTLKMILLKSSYAFDYAHDNYDDISAYEISLATGYTAGGKELSGGTWSKDNTNDRGAIVFDDVVWSPYSGEAIGGLAIYSATNDDKPLIGIDVIGTPIIENSSFTVKTPTIEIV